MFRTLRWRGTAVLFAALLGLSLTVGVGATAAPTVVVTGLNTPFFITVDGDGALYYYDLGAANTETIPPPPGAPPDTPPLTRGLTASITRIAANGTKTTIASGLPSGLTGITVANGFVWQIIGASPAALYGAKPYPNEGFLVKIDPKTGTVTPVADLASVEIKGNPDGTDVNPNPYGLVYAPDGNLYATDAGGNTLLRINPATGEIKVVVVFPTIPGTEPNPELGGKLEAQAVPTGLAVAPDGGLFVAYLPGEGGTPAPGSGQVVHVTLDGKITKVASGFNFAVNVAVGPDKLLYVAELVGGFGPDGPAPGRVTRVLADGTKQIVLDGLDFPHGLAFDKAGNLFVTTSVVSFGPPPPSPAGLVVRIDGVARVGAPTPSATPAPSTRPSPVPSPPATGNGGTLPGLPNTGAGGGSAPVAPWLPVLALATLAGAGLTWRRLARSR